MEGGSEGVNECSCSRLYLEDVRLVTTTLSS